MRGLLALCGRLLVGNHGDNGGIGLIGVGKPCIPTKEIYVI